jgi:hypothetical protein
MLPPERNPLRARLRAVIRPVATLNPVATSQRTQALILGGFIGFQGLDSVTTHLGLAIQHEELNGLMAPLIANRGELAAFAFKGTAVAMLLGVLMLMQRRNPRVWQAFLVAGWLSAAAVVANVLQLL